MENPIFMRELEARSSKENERNRKYPEFILLELEKPFKTTVTHLITEWLESLSGRGVDRISLIALKAENSRLKA